MKTIPNNTRVQKITFHPQFSTICSVGNAPFWGIVNLEYKPGGELLEFESFEKYLESYALEKYTIESITQSIFDNLVRVLGDIPLRVEIQARTTVHAPASAVISQKWSNNEEKNNMDNSSISR